MMKPFSDNVVFVDTEFSSLDPYQGEMLSIGPAAASGGYLWLTKRAAGAAAGQEEERTQDAGDS